MPPLPKKKHSRTRRGGRSAHFGLTKPSFGKCPNCESPKLPHRVCRSCGHYNGNEIIPVETDVE